MSNPLRCAVCGFARTPGELLTVTHQGEPPFPVCRAQVKPGCARSLEHRAGLSMTLMDVAEARRVDETRDAQPPRRSGIQRAVGNTPRPRTLDVAKANGGWGRSAVGPIVANFTLALRDAPEVGEVVRVTGHDLPERFRVTAIGEGTAARKPPEGHRWVRVDLEEVG